MRKTNDVAADPTNDTPSVENVHDLRLTALLYDLVEAKGRRSAAGTLCVSYGALARAADTGRLTGRMRDALTRHLLEGGKVDEDEERDGLAELERRVAELEEGARNTPGAEDTRLAGLREALSKIGEEQERHDRRIAALESQGPVSPTPASEPVADRLPLNRLVLSLHPAPGDDEKRFGAAAPLVAEWRRLREEYRAAPDVMANLRAEEDLLELEMVLVGGCGVTLPPADYPWDRFDIEGETRRRKRRLAVVREEIRRAELRRRFRLVCTLGIWRR